MVAGSVKKLHVPRDTLHKKLKPIVLRKCYDVNYYVGRDEITILTDMNAFN